MLFGIDNEPIADSSNLVKSGGVYAQNRISDSKIEAILGKFFIDINHCVSENAGVYNYVQNDIYDCIWIPILKESTKITAIGIVDNYVYRYFSSFEIIDTTTFVGSNSTGIVPTGAVLCIRSLKKENYPNGYGDIVITQDNYYIQKNEFNPTNILSSSVYPNYTYVDYNHVCSYDENGNFIDYVTSQQRDSAWLFVPTEADHIEIKGVESVGYISFFSELTPTTDSYKSHLSTGEFVSIPNGTKLIIIHFSHSENPSGLGNLAIETYISTSRDKQTALNIQKGCFIDYNHSFNISSSVFTRYSRNNGYDCIWCNISDDDYIVVPDGITLSDYTMSFFSGLIPSVDNFLGTSNNGLVISGARLVLINILHATNILGFGSLEIIKVKKSFTGRDFYLLHNRTVSVDTTYKRFAYNNNYDLLIIPINNTHIMSVDVKLNGAPPEFSYRYFDDSNISQENYLDANSTGILPTNTKLVTLAIKKSTYPNGYSVSFDKNYRYQPLSESVAKRKKIRMLLIGNSASNDALSYVPFILQNMDVDVDIQLGVLMMSSSTLEDHVNNFNNETAAYTFSLYNGGNSWQNLGSKTIQWTLDNYEWDIISLQQAQPQNANTYQPYCNQLINLISGYTDYAVKFIWYQTHIYAATTNGGAPRSEETIQSYYESEALASKAVLDDTVCESIVPVSTAIQNARSIVALKTVGDYATNPNNSTGYGYLNYFDGVHLQEGLPCQIAAYTFILVILDICGFKEFSINGETTRVTSEWSTGKNIPSPHGDPIGSTDENCLMAQKCAIMAIKNPYEVTDMNYLINPS